MVFNWFLLNSQFQLHINPGFVPPHLSLEFLAKAGMFHPHLPNLAGKFFHVFFVFFMLLNHQNEVYGLRHAILHKYSNILKMRNAIRLI